MVMRAFGTTVAMDIPVESVGLIAQLLPPNYRVAPGAVPARTWHVCRAGHRWEARIGAEQLGTWPDLDAAVSGALSDMELWVAEHARPWVFVHAGCVVFHEGAVVVPGRTMAGKTSLTTALVRAGGAYYSDEYAVLDSSGRVRPYARPLSIRPYDGGPAQRMPVGEIDGRAGRGPAPVSLIAAVVFDRSAGWAAEEVSPGSAVMRLLDNAVAGRHRPKAVLSALVAAAERACCVVGTRGDADETAAILVEMLADHPVRSPGRDVTV